MREKFVDLYLEKRMFMVHHWLGWISFGICILLLAKYLGRISHHKKLNQLLRKLHQPLGLAVIGIGALHGVISLVKAPEAVIQNVTGLLLFLLIAALARTFYARAKLQRKWFSMHRHLSLILIAVLVLHTIVSFS